LGPGETGSGGVQAIRQSGRNGAEGEARRNCYRIATIGKVMSAAATGREKLVGKLFTFIFWTPEFVEGRAARGG